MSVLILKHFHCVEVGPAFYLSSSMHLQCYTAQWYLYLPLAVFGMLSHVLGVPALFFCLLWRARNRGVQQHWRSIQKNPMSVKMWLLAALEDDQEEEGRGGLLSNSFKLKQVQKEEGGMWLW